MLFLFFKCQSWRWQMPLSHEITYKQLKNVAFVYKNWSQHCHVTDAVTLNLSTSGHLQVRVSLSREVAIFYSAVLRVCSVIWYFLCSKCIASSFDFTELNCKLIFFVFRSYSDARQWNLRLLWLCAVRLILRHTSWILISDSQSLLT